MTKTPILTGIAMLCVLVVVPAEPTEDTLELNDGSRLSGRVLAIEGSDKVVVDSSLSDEHIHLRAQSLSSISFRNDAANSQASERALAPFLWFSYSPCAVGKPETSTDHW